MSDQFYSYLSEKVISYFEHNGLKGGDKFFIQFETVEQVNALYEHLKMNTIVKPFQYKDELRAVEYSTYMLDFRNTYLIIAATDEETHPDFLTNLRNLVGVEEDYENKAILFVHNTSLDSLIGGTASLHKEGMPLHISEIEKDIISKLNSSTFCEADREIVKMTMENKKNNLLGNNVSVFEYEELLSIINKTGIETKDYPEFGLFPDLELTKYSGKDLKNRLADNAKNYSRVDEFHSYGLSDNYLERFYDEKGVDKLKDNGWKNVDYGVIEKSISDKKEHTTIEYVECVGAWDREEGTSKAKSRKRNIIAFDKKDGNPISIELSFSEHTKKDGIESKDSNVFCTSGGKKLRIDIEPQNAVEFHTVKYEHEDKVKFEFKILVVDVSEKCLEGIKGKYLIVSKKEGYILINSSEDQITLNEFAEQENTVTITERNQEIPLKSDRLIIKIGENYNFDDEDELAYFNIKINETIIPFGKQETKDKPSVIDGFKVWKMKKDNQSHFYLTADNKLRHGTKEYFTRDEFRKNLNLEKELIELNALSLVEKSDGIVEKDLQIADEIKEAYGEIIEYFRKNNVLPSLAFLNEELLELYQLFINVFIDNLDKITSGEYLEKNQKDLFYIGMVRREVEDKELLLSPLHPINIAYQIQLADLNFKHIEQNDIIKKLQSIYLLPFITCDPDSEEDKLFIPIEQSHSPEWKYYVDAELPRYKGSKEFVSKLVCEKIEEFIEHFNILFILESKAPLKINLIHTGDSREILQGIFKFYVRRLRDSKSVMLQPIEVYIYSDTNVTNAFDEFASIDQYTELIEQFDLDLKVEDKSPEEIIDLYRENVSFYVRDLHKEIGYAHLTFLEMNEENKIITTDMKDIHSGIILNGSISGTPSMFLGDSYRTGFGTQFANNNPEVMKIATKLNAINAAMTGDKFDDGNCKAISIAKKSQTVLDKIYEASYWVTFIDPKVDLNFFKNDPNAQDLLIIHYSDQYTSSGGYDAITVTRRSRQYQNVIESFLEDYKVTNSKQHSAEIINMFNAVNGDWLLRLISSRSHFPREKISILSAIKVAINKFKEEGIIWVPISLEEILRVSGGVGLKQSEGFFSAKNLNFYNNNSMSDDLLLVGIKDCDNNVEVAFYPVEVKIGINKQGYINKGIEQAKRTRELIYGCLTNENVEEFTKMIYRNFFMQLVVTSAEKLCLYNVVDESLGLEKVINSELRRKLLNEEYEIVMNLSSVVKEEAAVISFKKSCKAYNNFTQDNVIVLELSEKAAVNLLTKSMVDINTEDFSNSDFYDVTEENSFYEEVATTEEDNMIFHEEDYNIEGKESNESDSRIISAYRGITDKTDKVQVAEIDIDTAIYGVKEEKEYMKILFGEDQRTHRPLYWYPNDSSKVFHTNTGIIGTMGTGKTQFTKSVITQIHREAKYNLDGKDIGILIFDYKGDYNLTKADFIEATNAKVYQPYHLPFNPLALTITDNPKPLLPLHTANSLKETVAKAFALGIKQETILRESIMDAYDKKGIFKNDQSTWTNPAPTLNDVYNMYLNREDLKEDSLYAAFTNLIDFEVFEPNSSKTRGLFEIIQGVTVIDLSAFDPGIQNLVVAITLDLFYSQMQAYGHSKIDGDIRQLNKIILVDEADNFLSKNFSSLKKILKEGREFGVGTILSTQLLSHFSTGDNDYANYILTWVIHSVADLSMKDIKYLFNTKGKQEEEFMYNKIKELQKHYSIVKMGDSKVPINIRDKAFWELVK